MPTNIKKRKLQEISNAKTANTKQQTKIATKGGKASSRSQSRHSGDHNKENKKRGQSSGKEPKKIITNETRKELLEENSEEIELTKNEAQTSQSQSSQVIIGNMFSLYALADKQPGKIKTIIDEIFTHRDNTEEFVVKTMFLYFLEIMGLADPSTLQYDVQFIAKNTDEKKLLGLFNAEGENFDISFEKLIFFSTEKKAFEQKKLLKRICRTFVKDVVDVLPDKETYLTSVVQRICVFSKSQKRLVRYAFTFVGLYIFQYLLEQQIDLKPIMQQLEGKLKREEKDRNKIEAEQTKKQLQAIGDAFKIIKACLDTIQKYLIIKRSQDTIPLIRKSVFDFLLQLDDKQIQVAFTKDSIELFNVIFGSLKDDDQSIKKIGLQLLQQILSKPGYDEKTMKLIDQNLQKHKLQIFKLAIPTETHQDTVVIVKALQVIQRMISITPDIFNNEHLQILKNLVHHTNQSVREEIGNLLLNLSDEFDDEQSLMELQKIHPSKSNYDEFVVNFNEEPNKSQKQILKLIKMFEKHVQTRSQYIKQVNAFENEDEIQVPNLQKEQVQRILQSDCEERAILIFQTFQRKTSILYDVQSMCHLLRKEDQPLEIQQVLVNLMNIALSYCNLQRKNKDNLNLIFQKLWSIATGYLKLSVVNELLQTFRVNFKILDPLLKIVMTIAKFLEKDAASNEQANEMGKDLTDLLLKVIEKTDVDESQPETHAIIKNSILNLAYLQQHFPQIAIELKELALNFNHQLQYQVVPKLFQQHEHIPTELVSQLYKYNLLMSQVSLKDITDSDYLKGIASFTITNFTQMILDQQYLVQRLTRSQLTALIQVPFTLLDQLLCDVQQTSEHLKFQSKMFCHLVDFYLQLYSQLKVDETLQVVALSFIIECLILASGSGNHNKNAIVLSINDFPGVKELIVQLIQNVASRLKGNEHVVQEQFALLLKLFNQDFNSLLSEIGVEFLINFGSSKEQSILKEIRKLYYNYKQRDRLLMNTKNGIFYSLISKCISTIYHSEDAKVYRLLDVAPGDLVKEMNQQGFDRFNPPITLQVYQKLTLIQTFIKNFLNSIMLLVISNKSPEQQGANGLSKQQDEFAYFKMVETIIRQALGVNKDSYPLLLAVKFFMHKNFLTQYQQTGLVKSIKEYVGSVKEKLQMSEQDTQMIDFIISKIEEKTNPTTATINKKVAVKKLDESVDTSKDGEAKEEEEQEDDDTIQKEKMEAKETVAMIGKKRKGGMGSSDAKGAVEKKGGQAKKVKKTK